MAENPSFVIEELTGRKRSIRLAGRAKPLQGAEWVGEQREVTTWYPGNPEATQQILGPVEGPTRVHGYWNSRYIEQSGTSAEGFGAIITAEDLVKIFQDIRRTGAQLQVTWGFERRLGILRRFRAEYVRVEDVRWEAEFAWFRDQLSAPPAGTAPAFDAAAAMKNRMDLLDDATAFGPLDALQAFQARVFSKIAEIRAKVNEILDAIRIVANAVTFPLRVVQAIRTSAEALRFRVGELLNILVDTPYTLAQTTDAAASVVSMDRYRSELSILAQFVREQALEVARDVEARAEPNPTKIVTAAEGDLRAIARREYGDADSWQLIADVNNFEGSEVPVGTQVIVPPAPSGVT